MTTLTLNRRTLSSSVNMMMDVPLTPPLPTLKPVNTSSGSLYHNCRSVLDRLCLIEGMTKYLDITETTDPLTKLTAFCRQGFPLCKLYNALNPNAPLAVDSNPKLNAVNSCKEFVFRFIIGCRENLLLPEEDIFTISDLYQNDTNGFVKVVHTLNKVLQLLEDRGIITVRSSNRNSDPNTPKNTRDKVVMELLETERRYVQDMETLQNYMRELQSQKILSPDTIHYLFGNLNALLDFQRRFLIQLEEIAEKSAEQQRIGHLFCQMEEAFAVYEPYCSNYYSAQDLVVQETPRLMRLANLLDPTYQLPSLLIKPVQRICKYPLLLQELVKSTNPDWPYYQETLDSLDAIKRVAEKVNETQRQHENSQTVRELKKRLDDLPLEGYGDLLLQDKLMATTAENYEREFHVFLFERTLLLCKETKGNNILPTNTLSKKKRRGSLVPKVVAEAICLTEIQMSSKNGFWLLQVSLDAHETKQVSIKYRNEEQLRQWYTAVVKVHKRALECQDEILSMQLASRSPYVGYEDDDDEFYDDDEEDYQPSSSGTTLVSCRSRSGSFNSHLKPSLKPSSSTSTSSGRSYVPGMNLSPLPRSNSSFSTMSSNHCHTYFPVSPPPSHPSSPTTSTTRTPNQSNFYWPEEDALMPVEEEEYALFAQQHLNQHAMIKTGRSKSQPTTEKNPPLPNNNRLRSQSNPNLLKGNVSHLIDVLPPSLRPPELKPSTSTRLADIILMSPSQSSSSRSGTMKIKLIFLDNIYVIVAPTEITYFELMEKIERKIRLFANLQPTDILRLKYRDDDNDMVTINSDDDVQMAFETGGASNTVNLFVSL